MVDQQTKECYPITDCLDIIKGMFITPKYSQLTITAEAWVKLMCLINLVGDYEISGFGRIVNGKIVDFDILEQEVKPAYVESDAEAVTKFLMSLPEEQIAEWELDWHSHVNMGTHPSGTDTSNYAKMFEARMRKQFPFMIVNKKGEVTLQQYISSARMEDIDVSLEDGDVPETKINEIYEKCRKLVQEKCRRSVVVTTYQTTTSTWNPEQNKKKGFFGGKTGKGATLNLETSYEDVDGYYDVNGKYHPYTQYYSNYRNFYDNCEAYDDYDDYAIDDEEVAEAKKQVLCSMTKNRCVLSVANH